MVATSYWPGEPGNEELLDDTVGSLLRGAARRAPDTVAADYVERVPPPTEMDPLSGAMLAGFAELVRTASRGRSRTWGAAPDG
ncbi:hypothetical protein SRB17_88830 [Streptomyces sp. RB17]|nr:hypothetical protein [Streptomyces sp. RB17]